MLRDVSNCVYYIDDILVAGKNDQEHLASLGKSSKDSKIKGLKQIKTIVHS